VAAKLALERVGLEDRADRPASTLSRGLLQRLDLARATLHEPSLLVLDEPDTGLDSSGRQLLSRMMRAQAGDGGLVIFTSHALDFAIGASDRIVTLSGGEIADDRPSGTASVPQLEMAINSSARVEAGA
jgi:ABC-type multidrug transport system ATPase subunit